MLEIEDDMEDVRRQIETRERLEKDHPELLDEKWAEYIANQTDGLVIVDNQWPHALGESDNEDEGLSLEHRDVGCFTCDTPEIGMRI